MTSIITVLDEAETAARSPRPQLGPGGVGRRGRRRRGRARSAWSRPRWRSRTCCPIRIAIAQARSRRGAGRPDRRAPARDPARRDPRAPATAGARRAHHQARGEPRVALLRAPRDHRRTSGLEQRDRRRSCATRAIAASGARPGTPRSRSARTPPRWCASSRTCATRRRAALGYRDHFAFVADARGARRGLAARTARRSRARLLGDLGARRRTRSTQASERGSASPPASRCGRGTTPTPFFQDAPAVERRPARGRRSRHLDPRRRSRAPTSTRSATTSTASSRAATSTRATARTSTPSAPTSTAGTTCASSRTASRATRWLGTMVHELGHAVYDLAIDPELPWLLREPAHTFTTEAIAMLHGRLVRDETFLRALRGRRRPRSPAIRATPRCCGASCSCSCPGCRS